MIFTCGEICSVYMDIVFDTGDVIVFDSGDLYLCLFVVSYYSHIRIPERNISTICHRISKARSISCEQNISSKARSISCEQNIKDHI